MGDAGSSICRVPGCREFQYSRGLCRYHYDRFSRGRGHVDLTHFALPAKNHGGRVMSPTPWNPWAGRVPCPSCGSADWTMPLDSTRYPEWRCVQGRFGGCALTFLPAA